MSETSKIGCCHSCGMMKPLIYHHPETKELVCRDCYYAGLEAYEEYSHLAYERMLPNG